MEKTTQNIESLVIEGRPWSRRLADLARMNYDDINVSMEALIATGHAVCIFEDKGWDRPSIFADTGEDHDNGVTLEWVKLEPFRHLEVKVSGDGVTFEAFWFLDESMDEGVFETIIGANQLFGFIENLPATASPIKEEAKRA